MSKPENSEPNSSSKRYVRPVSELWEMWKPRVKFKVYPFTYAQYEDVERVMTSLTSYDRDKWAAAWSAIAKPYEEKAAEAEKVQMTLKPPKKTIFAPTTPTGWLGTQPLILKEKKLLTGNLRKCFLRLHVTLRCRFSGLKFPSRENLAKETKSSLICECQKKVPRLSLFL